MRSSDSGTAKRIQSAKRPLSETPLKSGRRRETRKTGITTMSVSPYVMIMPPM